MINPEDLEKCHFVPMSIMRKVIDLMECQDALQTPSNICKRNLALVQSHRSTRKLHDLSGTLTDIHSWKSVHQLAVCKAIYSHDWDKLLYLLKKCPPWEHNYWRTCHASIYFRALTILLMYHPTSQAKGLFSDFLHMVWSCRTDEDKKAILKIILTLPDKLYKKVERP
ncbi:uncharacterized protein LOC115444711 [Manduca sexta]|uniref:uncharacterized protein LOC115444711 n=1 Tax=Manduca sexta TaxID=7130 RepID=UPI0011821E21|nr:uncharacterized protein LOC115444711 [Manduca sexta]